MLWNPARILLAPLCIDLILSAFSRVSTSPVLNVKSGRDHENLLTFSIYHGFNRIPADATASVFRPGDRQVEIYPGLSFPTSVI